MPTLAEKRKEWLEVLSGEDRHSIISQITRMTWDATAFGMVNEAVRLAPRDPDGGRQLNGLMHSLLDRAFFTSHMAAVRRLTDKSSWKGTKGVYSLSALLQDMLTHRKLLTREAIFASEGLEYDYEPIRQKYFEHKNKEKKPCWVPDEVWCHKHENRHKQIDRLAGVLAQDRQRGDTVREKVFKDLQNKIDKATEDVKCHVDKCIAHAATPGSREIVGADEAALTLNHLWQAHQHLSEVAGFLDVYVVSDGCLGYLAIPQYDQFKYIERPLIDASQVHKLQDFWRRLEKKYHSWSQWGLDQYAKEFEKAP